METLTSCNFGRQWQLSLQFNLEALSMNYPGFIISWSHIYYASIMCSAAWVHLAWWDQSPMQNTVSVIAEGHCPAMPITVLCIHEIRPHHAQMHTLWVCLVFFAAAALYVLCAHSVWNVDRGNCCCLPVTNRRLKHAAVREKCPQTHSHSTHTATHPINDQRSSKKGSASLQGYWHNMDFLNWVWVSHAQCNVGTKI